ncbi:MAG: periplasmic heavy metal sensor [Betaproteobacteria bacterium]|nr:periplasmic heavy metal sensor [Betaproteobacteria bacterium]
MNPNSLRTGIALVSLFFLAAGASAALAHGTDNARAPQIENMLAALKGKLALDTSQQVLWDHAFAQSLAAREAARSGGVRLRDAMQAELAKTEPDLARIAALADDVQANTQAARRQARDEWLKLYATFAPDQKTVIRDLAKVRMERFARFAGHWLERDENRGRGRPY